MLLRSLHNTCNRNVLQGSNIRFISLSVSRRDDSNKISHGKPGELNDLVDSSVDTLPTQKTVYPKVKIRPRLTNIHVPEENPFTRVRKAFAFDYKVAKARMEGTPPPKTLNDSDIVIIGGGILGSCIACQLAEAAGVGLSIVVIEKDPGIKGLSSSLSVASNVLHQQVNSKPKLEMAQYAAEFYRELPYTFDDPDLPPVDIDFQPGSSLQLASEGYGDKLEELSALYEEFPWKHQLLSPAMLKKRFPWMNIDGVSFGSLGMQKEGIIDQWKALTAIRQRAMKYSCMFVQGEVVAFEFDDQSDYCSVGEEFSSRSYAPCRVVVQLPNGELVKFLFGFAVIAAGSGTSEVVEHLNVTGTPFDLPLKSQKQFLYEVQCSGGPGIEMPFIMDSLGLKFRKSDIIDKYFIWKENPSILDENSENLNLNNEYFLKEVLPQVTHRVPSLKNAKLLTTQEGQIQRCTWDDNPIIGSLPMTSKIFVAAGLGYDLFLYAPAVARCVSELILERDYKSLDLSCFRLERIGIDHRIENLVVQ